MPTFPSPRILLRSRVRGLREEHLVAHAARGDGAELLVLANAYDGAFSTCAPDCSAYFLATLTGRFREGEAPEASLESALAAFFERFPADPEDDWLYDPALSFAAVWRLGAEVRMALLGGERVRAWRDGVLSGRWPPGDEHLMHLGSHTTLLRLADRAYRHPVLWTALDPRDTVELLSFRLSELVGTTPAPDSSEDPRWADLLEEATFGVVVRWGP